MKKEHPAKNFPNGGAAIRFGLLLSVFLLGTSAANAQQNYWMARQADTTYVFDQQVPQSFGDAITKPSSSQFQVVWDPQNFEPQTVGGTTYRFVKVSITSDYEMFENRLPKRSVSMKSKDGSGGAPQSWIEMSSSDPLVEAFASQLPSREMGKWFSADLIICVSPSGNQPQSVRMSPEAIHEQQLKQQLTQHEQIMGKLAENVSPGSYFPSVKKPADLLAFQQEMLRYGNLGRRDPDFRKRMGSKTATNLEADSVQTQNGPQKVFKSSTTAPYFRDHTLRENLNNAAQFQAEYQASIGQMTHDGPGSYVLNGTSRNMTSIGQRSEAFGGGNWEACGGGSPGNAPYAWMKSETHFRPWFNVNDFHLEVGYGAAQAADGKWYYAAVGIAKKEDELPADQKLAVPTQPMSPQPAPAQSATANATPPWAANQTKSIHEQGSEKLDIYVTNKTGQALILFWVDGDGTEAQTPTTVPPDAENFNIGFSYPGHLFRFKIDNQLVHSWVIQEGQPNLTIQR